MSEGQRPRYRHAYATPILLQGENSSGIQRKPLIRTTYSLQTSDLPPSAANPRDHPYSIASPGCPPSVVLRIHCTVALPPSAAAGHHIANIGKRFSRDTAPKRVSRERSLRKLALFCTEADTSSKLNLDSKKVVSCTNFTLGGTLIVFNFLQFRCCKELKTVIIHLGVKYRIYQQQKVIF